MDFSKYKFRCSSLPTLMTGAKSRGLSPSQQEKLDGYYRRMRGEETDSRGKVLSLTPKMHEDMKDLETKRDAPPELNKAVKSELLNIYIQEVYGKNKIISSKPMIKGTQLEDESISLYRKFTQDFTSKNEDKLENNYLCGTPDLIKSDRVIDIKTPYDIWTFAPVTEDQAMSDYYWQLVGYMILTQKPTAELAYCLTSHTELMIVDETRRIAYMENLLDDDGDPEKHDRLLYIEDQVRKNYSYEDIPLKKRVKRYELNISEKAKTMLYNQLDLCREYLNNLSL